MLHTPPLIAHVVESFDTGGLENGVVNLVNGMPRSAYCHAIISVKRCGAFRDRISRDDVPFIELRKEAGAGLDWYGRLWRVLRRLRPAIVHTRNLGTLEAQAVAAAAGPIVHVHGEHGREVWDLHGTNRKYNLLRRALRPCIDRYVAVSRDLERWLTTVVRVPTNKVTRIYNGVDTRRFCPLPGERPAIQQVARYEADTFVIGTVGRMATVKDQVTLTRAFLHLIRTDPRMRRRLRLAMIGDGPLRAECLELLAAADALSLCWLPGERNDIPELLRTFDLFVLPSIAEGLSNTILEAMATAVPVVATDVGGNPELVTHDITGTLVRPSDHLALADAIRAYVDRPSLGRERGDAGRRQVEASFSLRVMIDRYTAMYGHLLDERGRTTSPQPDAVVCAGD